jgi:hypothetical protein
MLENVTDLCNNKITMENTNNASENAYKALMGSIFGTAKPVDENPINDRRAAIWLHENFTEDQIWEMYDTIKWEHEMSNPDEESGEDEVAPVIDIRTRKTL